MKVCGKMPSQVMPEKNGGTPVDEWATYYNILNY